MARSSGARPSAAPDGSDVPAALWLEELILGERRRYTAFQAARAAGVPMELAVRFWRAMGFADIGQQRALTDADVISLRRLAGLVESGLLTESLAVQVARSTGQTTARLAEWQIDSLLEHVSDTGASRSEVVPPLVELLLPELEQFLVYVWRRQLAAVTGRVAQANEEDEVVDRRLAVGFADLVGFTRLSRHLEEEDLGELVEAFETTCADIVAAQGGRLIKTLGDEVLFVSEDAVTAAEIALRLIEAMAGDDNMPALRVGMAFGTVTSRMGDVFGTTVNLASRLTSVAQQDAAMIDPVLARELMRAGASVLAEYAAAGDAYPYRAAGAGVPGPGWSASGGTSSAGSVAWQRPEEEAGGDAAGARRPGAESLLLQPMWRRPVRGLGMIEPWQLTRRREV
ncbi:adenylate cyclase [Allostreptomyces psammosilenae]|uniref:Adenylate cyclase n=1 Tax=Allostreptomyces psammosilenae TaxID=1892865 RepID=A0A852ZVZ7_9ACTN|nr:adenylate cyclase [Allostreptomyces psammosilenae]